MYLFLFGVFDVIDSMLVSGRSLSVMSCCFPSDSSPAHTLTIIGSCGVTVFAEHAFLRHTHLMIAQIIQGL